MKNLLISCLPAIFLAAACQQTPGNRQQSITPAWFETGPKLVKIDLKSSSDADSLLAHGFELIVVEPEYVIARLNSQSARQVQNMSLPMSTFDEKELVQRLIRVVIQDSTDLSELGNTGIDIWEVRGDTVIAQAFDNYIRRIESLAYEVEIVEQDIRNLVRE
jgi:hypothetical protein